MKCCGKPADKRRACLCVPTDTALRDIYVTPGSPEGLWLPAANSFMCKEDAERNSTQLEIHSKKADQTCGAMAMQMNAFVAQELFKISPCNANNKGDTDLR